MLKILDKYIIKRFLGTLFFICLILSVIYVIGDISQKLDRIDQNGSDISTALVQFYPYLVVYLVNTFLPVAIFIAVIYFTSRMAMQTEFIAMMAGGQNVMRIFKPYLMVAIGLMLAVLLVNNFILPWANLKKNSYEYKYMLSNRDSQEYYARQKVNAQISKDEYLFISSYDRKEKLGRDFVYQKFDGRQLKEEIRASGIRWQEEDSTYRLNQVYGRKVLSKEKDSLYNKPFIEKNFGISPDEILPEGYVASTMNSIELNQFIEREKFKGSSSINAYLNELLQRNTLPFSSIILTILGFGMASKKRRGGIGLNLVLGIVLALFYVFFNQATLIFSENAILPPLLAVWLPNITFGILAFIIFRQRLIN